MFLDCLVAGSGETKELAAEGVRLLVAHTSAESLAPFVLKMTGPLIRVVGEHGGDVKVGQGKKNIKILV